MKIITSTLLWGCLTLFAFSNTQAQNTSEIAILPAYNPSSVKLKIVSGGNCLSNQSYLTAENSVVEVMAFASEEYDAQELKVPMVHIDLVRKGMLVGKTTFTGQGDLSNLMSLAQNGDVFVFGVQKLLIKANDNEYQTFTSGRISFQYEFKEENGLVLNR